MIRSAGLRLCFCENYNPNADDGGVARLLVTPGEDGCNLEGDLNGDCCVQLNDLLDLLKRLR